MRWVVVLIVALAIAGTACSVGLTDSFVQDNAGLIPADYSSAIASELRSIYNSGKAEFVVVTVDSLDGKPIEDYAFDLAEGNLGDENKNNGLLLLVAVQEREYRFEVGRGLEPIFNDAKVGRYGRDYLVPAFKEGNYGAGILAAVQAVAAELDIDGAIAPRPSVQMVGTDDSKIHMMGVLVVIALFVLMSTASRRRRSNKYFAAAWVASSMLRGPRGGFGGGGFGGGFGGFGGGSFGGGGAGGGW